MTLQSSGPISIANVCAEFGFSLPQQLGSAQMRAKAGKPTGPISLHDFYGLSNTIDYRLSYSPITLSSPTGSFNSAALVQNQDGQYYTSAFQSIGVQYHFLRCDFGSDKLVTEVEMRNYGRRNSGFEFATAGQWWIYGVTQAGAATLIGAPSHGNGDVSSSGTHFTNGNWRYIDIYTMTLSDGFSQYDGFAILDLLRVKAQP